MSSTPNLFTYATSELSQDAVIAYLLAWADPTHQDTEGKMHIVGQCFVHKLLKLHGVEAATITSVEVKAQYQHIDVLARVVTDQGEYALVVEDKIHAGSYNNLSNYLAAAGQAYPNAKLLGIYLRTGSQADYSAIEAEDFRVLDRTTFLKFLESEASNGLSNAILLEYRRHLSDLEKEYGAYKSSPIKDWNDKAWVGFYHDQLLKSDDLNFAGYGYVSNPQGGFHGCWWFADSARNFAGYPVYLQMEQHIMKFKVGPVEAKSQRTATVKKVYQHIDRTLSNKAEYGIERPGRLSPGKYMTAARIDLAQHLGDSAGYSDLLRFLGQVQEVYYQLF